ncbi:DUF3098 domain-containing protein [Riemerella columbipharyngis]|uniref:DUF3098 domain-containing protein n=1 Tax=Riemerella columbipharyngis TaxID=1071918 RepID=A0A1G7FSZ1_9FLAO|nr:DUF3098 domain-containing protein [Riemerella columbipharyngis]SDE78902.1 Protein of unknown function [Riemerella columbipharyngis]
MSKYKSLPIKNTFYFGKSNYLWMLIGIVLIALGFILMMGYGANTKPDGTFDPNYWNEDIFSIRRIRIAPLLIFLGFVAEGYAIMKRTKK